MHADGEKVSSSPKNRQRTKSPVSLSVRLRLSTRVSFSITQNKRHQAWTMLYPCTDSTVLISDVDFHRAWMNVVSGEGHFQLASAAGSVRPCRVVGPPPATPQDSQR